jgi:hypothetical protein
MRGGDRISFAAAGSSEFDRAVLRVGLAYALFGLTLGLEIQQDAISGASRSGIQDRRARPDKVSVSITARHRPRLHVLPKTRCIIAVQNGAIAPPDDFDE